MAAKLVRMALVGLLMLSGARAFAQEETLSPARVREALRQGIELHKAKNYEKAATFFGIAKSGEQALSPAELKDLSDFSARNAAALKGRQDGAAQLQEAKAALQKGKTQEAAKMLSSLNGNQYLSAEQVREANELSQKLPASAKSAGPDRKALLAAGREALKAGDLVGAEKLANQAEKASSGWFPFLNDDDPAKLRRDIQAAKARLQAPPEPKVAPAEAKGSSWWPLDRVFGKSDPQPAAPPKKDDLKPLSSDEKAARQMLNDCYIFLQANDIEKARIGAQILKDKNLAWGPNERTPDMLLAEIAQRTGGPTPMGQNAGLAQSQAPQQPAPKKAVADAAKPRPVQLDPKADPRILLKQGRDALAQRNLEAADKACSMALAAKANWGYWEDTPEKLRRDLVRAHQSADRDEAVRLMVEARRDLTANKLDDAEKKAYKAQQLHGPYGIFDFGERPAKFLEEVRTAKLAEAKKNPQGTQIAKKDGPAAQNPQFTQVGKDGSSGIPAGVQNANKNRAIVMVREARELERLGLLAQARQKALEARALKAPFLPDEDSPDNILLGLSARADREIQAHMQQSVALAHNVNDKDRFHRAAGEILAARQLAVDFGLDLSRIDFAMSQLRQVEAGNQPLTAVTANPNPSDPFQVTTARMDVPTGDPKADQLRKMAREKLLFAQRELAAGKFDAAARLAEELCNPAYGVREEALRLLRSINAEEHNQRIVEAKRTFDSGLDSVARKDFRRAMYLFQAIDPLYLPAEYQTRMRDVMAMREMQPQAPEQQYQQPAYLKAVAFEGKGPATPRGANPEPEEDLIKKSKDMEKVQYEMLRQRGYEALKTAHEKFKAGQKQEAVQTLETYCQSVNEAQLSERARTIELLRPAENRIQQYKTLIADKALANAGAMKTVYTYHDEGKRVMAIQKQQEEVQAMLKEGAELYKQGKLKEAGEIGRKVLAIDPENPAGLVLAWQAQVKYNQQQYDKEIHNNNDAHVKVLNEQLMPGDGRIIDFDDPISFDKDRLARRKPSGDGGIQHEMKDLKERQIEYRLKQPISLNFKDTPLRDAITTISIASGVQVVPDLRALQDNKINLDAPLSGGADNIAMKNLLNILLKPMRLTYIIEDQVLKITTEDRTVGRLVRITYPIADLIVPVEDHPLPDVYDMAKITEHVNMLQDFAYTYGMAGMGGSFPGNPGMPVSHGLGNTFGSQNGQTSPQPGRPRNKIEVAKELVDLIQNTIAKNTWEEMGGTGNIQFFPMGLALVITQPQEVQEEVQLLLATLRKLQDLQVSVELRAVLVSETFFERIGVDFNMNIQTPISRTEPNLLNNTFVQAPFLNRVGSGLNMISGLTSAGTLTPDLNIPITNNTFALTTPTFGGYQPTAGLQLGMAFLSDIQVFMFLEAVQGDRRAHIMQAPKLTVYNGQTATIGGFMQRPAVMGMTPNQQANGALFMSPAALMQAIPFGLIMTVQPVVSPDRRFIRLNVTPQLIGGAVQDPAAAIVQLVPQAVPTTLDGGILVPPLSNNPAGAIIQPQAANVFIAQTTVNVPDGGTVLLGGFKFLAEERTEYGPPVLSNIPYLSRLFRNVGWSRDGSTLIYLVTARVIMIEEEENIFLGNIPPIPGR